MGDNHTRINTILLLFLTVYVFMKKCNLINYFKNMLCYIFKIGFYCTEKISTEKCY